MLELIAQNPGLKTVLLVLLFAVVAAFGFFSTRAFSSRQVVRQRLIEAGHAPRSANATMASLRTDRVQSNWLKLVDAIEKRGLSLVDTKDQAIRQRLIAAG